MRGMYADDHNDRAFYQCRPLVRNPELGVSRVRRAHGWPCQGIPVPRSMRKRLAVGLGERVREAANASPPQGSHARTCAAATASAGDYRRPRTSVCYFRPRPRREASIRSSDCIVGTGYFNPEAGTTVSRLSVSMLYPVPTMQSEL